MGGAVGCGVREAISYPWALTQQFPFSGSFSGLGRGSLRVCPGSESPLVWDLAQGSLFLIPRKHSLQSRSSSHPLTGWEGRLLVGGCPHSSQ